MATNVQRNQPQSGQIRTTEAEGQASATAPAETPLGEVLAWIHLDSRRDSRQYLDETKVPHGGE